MAKPSGTFQSGITNRPPEHNLVVALQFAGEALADPAQARATTESLRAVCRAELKSDLDELTPTSDKSAAGAETGELGFRDGYDRAHLTITVGFSKSGYDRLGVPAEQQPQDLIPIPWAALTEAPSLTSEHGDLVVQICSDDLYVVEHVLRRIEEELGDRLVSVWAQLGAQRYTTRQGRTSRSEGRALIGFIDGSSNLDPRHEREDAALVFVDPAAVGSYPPLPSNQPAGYAGTNPFPADLRPPPASEPEWTKSGSYMVVRASAENIAGWDDQPLGEQETTIGRFKFSGAFLDVADDSDRLDEPPMFATDQSNETVPVSSHVRKANPRRPEDRPREIFRRGYPLLAANAPGLQRGLLFICFARSISTQFEFIWRAWMKNPNFPREGAGQDRLLAIDQVLCGGYYFVPPLAHRNQPWSWIVPGPLSG